MGKSAFLSAFATAVIVGTTCTSLHGQTVTIGTGMTVVSGGLQVSVSTDNFVNDGIYLDTMGTFNLLNGVEVSGIGTTTLRDLNVKQPGSTVLNSLLSVRNTATVASSANLNANNNLFLRSDISPTANLVVQGVLTGNVQGLVTNPTVSVAPCPSYSSDVSTNVSGSVVLYQWQWSTNGTIWSNIPGATNAIYNANVTTDKYYRCELATSNSAYSELTPDVTLTLTGVPEAVTVTGDGIYCGQKVISATGGAGGAIYYQGSTSNGTSVLVPFDTALVTSDGTYFFRSRSSAGCWGVQDSAVVVVKPLLTPSVTLFASPGTRLCPAVKAVFTTTSVNGGTGATYQWHVNSVPVGTGGTSYSYFPSNGDEVKVTMTSSEMCATVPTVNDTAAIQVETAYIPIVFINAPTTNIRPGETLKISVTTLNAGPGATYQWYKNGNALTGATDSTYTSNTFVDGDSVSCVVTSSGMCALSSFNSLIIRVRATGLFDLASGDRIGILPNPNSGSFEIKGTVNSAVETLTLQMVNMFGQVVYSAPAKITNGILNEYIQLKDVASGSYILSLTSAEERAAFHVTILK